MLNVSSFSSRSSSFVPLRLADRPLAMRVLAVAVGTLVLAASSWIEVPMVPVPITMQTYAVIIVAALYGWRLGTATVLAWLGEASVGLPVLSGGAGGITHFWGPTAGYLVGFPVAAAIVGWLAERRWTAGNVVRSFAAMLFGHAACLTLGVIWLATLIGSEAAIALGLMPFIFGSVLKSGLAVVTIEAARRSCTE